MVLDSLPSKWQLWEDHSFWSVISSTYACLIYQSIVIKRFSLKSNLCTDHITELIIYSLNYRRSSHHGETSLRNLQGIRPNSRRRISRRPYMISECRSHEMTERDGSHCWTLLVMGMSVKTVDTGYISCAFYMIILGWQTTLWTFQCSLPVCFLMISWFFTCCFVFCGHIFWYLSLLSTINREDRSISLPIDVMCVMLAISLQQMTFMMKSSCD